MKINEKEPVGPGLLNKLGEMSKDKIKKVKCKR